MKLMILMGDFTDDVASPSHSIKGSIYASCLWNAMVRIVEAMEILTMMCNFLRYM